MYLSQVAIYVYSSSHSIVLFIIRCLSFRSLSFFHRFALSFSVLFSPVPAKCYRRDLAAVSGGPARCSLSSVLGRCPLALGPCPPAAPLRCTASDEPIVGRAHLQMSECESCISWRRPPESRARRSVRPSVKATKISVTMCIFRSAARPARD